ncbi:MAG: succinyl-diaminopimelate desuccinylase, partial [Alphaproteobacteria bacterium]|nr:succinyl-diaminopimelate desuccinylase [Alphaproteobacteria bacterium]
GTPDVDNLYARLGDGAPNLCFAGHTDVVPPGPVESWSSDPFSGEIRDGVVQGRGAADMKGAIACWVAAVARRLDKGPIDGSISLLITGDEEGPAINGTAKILHWLVERDETLDACITGEPTNPEALGEMIKIGRRGSLNGLLTVEGIQGHVAYPHLADNAAHRLVTMMDALIAEPLDEGSEHFQPSVLQVTGIESGMEATNIIPGSARAAFNARFNDLHTSETLTATLRERLDKAAGGAAYGLEIKVSGESFYTPPGPLSDLVGDAVEKVLGTRPELSTTGGTSDSRFIKDHCPVLDFGLVGQTMHKIDERVAVTDIENLTAIYEAVIDGYFA